jgi:hypothetical protein
MDIETIIIENFKNDIGRLQINYDGDNVIYVNFYCDTGEETIFNIDLYNQTIEIGNLHKCENVKGSKILTNIIKITKEIIAQSKKINSFKLNLTDASMLLFQNNGCSLNLAHLYILLHGKSWYNRFKFCSEDYETELEKNENLCNTKLYDFFTNKGISNARIHKKYIKMVKLEENITITDYVRYIYNHFIEIQKIEELSNSICDNEVFILLHDIIEKVQDFIRYDRVLSRRIVKKSPSIDFVEIDTKFVQNGLSLII